MLKKSLILLSLILCYFASTWAQMDQKLPIDPNVRHGKLENGLTYYIRHNELPKERAEFFIAHNVGAVLEEDDQNGLAHFLEHMAFNGSTNFPGNTLIDYLETIGVKFGQNLNAYTSYDRTVYNISNVPVLRGGVIDSCLLILHDWSGSLLLTEEEIDKERGVIREEMRSYGGASWRIMEKMKPEILPGNQYGKRNIIGTEEIILNFKPETIRAFYKKWYRPDLQAIIVVGDINVDEIESKIKTLFADIPAAVNPAERIFYTVDDNEEPLVGIAQDPEATYTAVSIEYKHDPLPKELKGTVSDFMVNYFNAIASRIVGERLSELAQKADPPFINAYFFNSAFAGTLTKEAVQGGAYIKDNKIELGFKTILREMERVNRHGFTDSEYERARTSLLNSYENMYKERDKNYNSRYAQEYVRHFTLDEYAPGIEIEYELINQIAPNIPIETITSYIQELMSEKNIVLTLEGPEKEDIIFPSKETLLQWFSEVRAETIEAFVDNVITEPLMKEAPQGGKIVKEEKDERFGTTVLTLSNGVTVVIKTTDFKDNQILMTASSPGGSSHFDQKDKANYNLYGSLSDIGGVADFSQVDLRKILAGKTVSVRPTVNDITQGFSGSSSVKDFETMLQLIYLQMTAPRVDEEVAQSVIGRIKSQLESQEANPEIALTDTILYNLYEEKLLHSRIKSADMENIDYSLIMKWRKDRFKNANGLTFLFTGNINADESKELIAQYLGSLPSSGEKDKALPINQNYTKGKNINHFDQSMKNKKTTVFNALWTMMDYELKGVIQMDMLSQILRIIYTEKVREDEGGTYGVGVSGGLSSQPKGRAALQISFETQPGKEAHLNGIIHKELANIAANGPRQEDFDKVKEFCIKSYQEQIRENSYWSQVIISYYQNGLDRHNEYMNLLNDMTLNDIRDAAKAIVDSGNQIEVIMIGID